MAKKDEKLTNDAFGLLVESPYYWSKTGHTTAKRRDLAFKVRSGINISLDLKEELLAKAGFGVVQEKTWHLPE